MNKLPRKARSGSLSSGGGQNDHFYVPSIIDAENSAQSVTDNLDDIQATLLNFNRNYNKKMEALDAAIAKLDAKEGFPVGSVYIAVDDIHPHTKFGYGNWALTSGGRSLVGAGDGKTLGQTGGVREIALQEGHMPAHVHNVSVGAYHGVHGTDVQGGVRQTDVQGEHKHAGMFPGGQYGEFVDTITGNINTKVAFEGVRPVTASAGAHAHNIDINHSHNVDISHAHGVGEVTKGANVPFNIENPYFVVNIWYRVS